MLPMTPDLSEFLAWRDEVDEEHALDGFDMALAWFSAKGHPHDACSAAAIVVQTRDLDFSYRREVGCVRQKKDEGRPS